jgi:hypothetical protein
MPTTRRELLMTQEQLMKVKIKYLEDRIDTLEKSLSRVNNILGRFQMTENKEQGFKDIEIYESVGGGFDFDDEPTSKDNDNELI